MAGIFHAYYTVALAPAVAAARRHGRRRRRGSAATSAVGAITLAVATAATSVWGFVLLSRTVEWNAWLRIVVLAVGLAAALRLPRPRADPPPRRPRRRRRGTVRRRSLGPAAYSVQTVATGHSGSIVDAGPAGPGTGGPGGGGGAAARHPAARPRARPGRRDQAPGATGGRPGGTGGPAAAWAVCSTPRPRARRWSRPSRPTRPVHVGRRGHRLAERRGSPARHAAAGHGHRRVQRQRPVTDAGAVPGLRPGREDPLLRSAAAGSAVARAAAATPRRRSPRGSQQNFTAVTIGGSTFYDLTQPASGTTGATSSTGTV